MSWLDVTEVRPKLSGGVYVVRFLNEDTEEPFAPFSGVCTVDTTVSLARVYGMLGRVHRQHLRAFLQWLLAQEVTTLRAHRAPGWLLPGGVREGGWTVVDLLALENRL